MSTKVFTSVETIASINHLFKFLWPKMIGAGERLGDCLREATRIERIVNNERTHDARLKALIQLHGIKATIGSGLLWSFFPAECVPFDKHTMGYCVMDLKVITDPRITDGTYERKCERTIALLPKHAPPLAAIEDLVRWAAQHRTLEVEAL